MDTIGSIPSINNLLSASFDIERSVIRRIKVTKLQSSFFNNIVSMSNVLVLYDPYCRNEN